MIFVSLCGILTLFGSLGEDIDTIGNLGGTLTIKW
jgi:hypothetical protein